MKKIYLSALAAVAVIMLLGFNLIESESKFNFHQFWQHYNDAQYALRVKKNYPEALRNFDWMYENGNETFPDANMLSDHALCFVKTGDSTNALEYLRHAAKKGYNIPYNKNAIVAD